jgi:hypothetical protein
MDEFSVTSANLDQTDQDFLAREVPDEIMEAAAEALNICRITFGGWPSTTAACCNPPDDVSQTAQLVCMPAGTADVLSVAA